MESEFYRGMYENTGGMEPSTNHLTIGDHFGDFGNEACDLKSTGIFFISVLGAKIGFIQMIPCEVTDSRGDYKRTALGLQKCVSVDRL
ncbi:hypothetical protein AVEN_136148-1 [Araneus ventricosus]|uniref:Uncharacterized protein n=1 Tax=Araneus ventricosus TaxID=182803 RepID=A0A4Y2S7D5_ARAVE|nr:hypothetical protein AVEN_136148-1 [Araneus ventricosus]